MMTPRGRTLVSSLAAVALVLAGVLAIAGCSSGGPKGGQIEARTWHVRAFAQAGGDLKDAPLTVPLSARYESGKVSGTAGCSTFTGSYTITAEKLSVTDVQVVKGSCDQIAMDADATYMAALPRAATFTVDGNDLSIFDKDGKEILHHLDERAFQNP